MVIVTFNLNQKRLLTRLRQTTNPREDWRLIALVLVFAGGILLRFLVSGFELTSNSLVLVFAVLAFICALVPRELRSFLFPLAICVLGYTSAQFKLEQLPKQSIDRETFVELSGLVTLIEYRTDRPTRLTLKIENISKETWLVGRKVRLSIRTGFGTTPFSGQRVSLRAVLSQPPGAIVPDGFNFGRYNQFKGIASQGFAVTEVVVESGPQASTTLQNYIENARSSLSRKVLNAIEQPLGGVAVALITGQRQYMDAATANNLRDAGLAHLLAISGLHMGLLTGVAFFIFELLFAAISAISLRITPRKLAAVVAWVVAIIYLGLSGASTSTIRAFIMVSIAIIAVLTDRRVLSLRSVAVAGFVILLLSPDSIFSSGFQMSFAATIGIVVAYDYLLLWRQQRPTENSPYNRPGPIRIVFLYLGGAAATSLIAQLAVGPIALYHFQTFSLVGIAANVVAIPLMAFIVMPAAFLGIVFSFVGLEQPFLAVMETGLFLITTMAEGLAAHPNSIITTMPYDNSLMLASGLAIILLLLWRGTVTLLAALLLVVMTLVTDNRRPADILISGTGNIIAQQLGAGTAAIIGGRRNGFRDDAWKRYWGIRISEDLGKLERSCDSRACKTIIKLEASEGDVTVLPIVISRTLGTTRQACNAGSIVVASYTHRRFCRGAATFLASEDIKKYGPVGLWSQAIGPDKSSIRYKWSNPADKDR